MEFLGVVLEKGQIHMDPTKLKGVADWPPPKSVKDVRAFLGFTGFYILSHTTPRLQDILINLTRKAVPFHWETLQIQSFRNPQNTDVQLPHSLTTRLHQTIPTHYRHIGIRRGHHTLTGGRNTP